jgi:cell division protein FtsX
LAAVLARWADSELSALTPGYVSDIKVAFLAPRESLGAVVAAGALGLAGAWLAVSREIRRFSAP